MVFMDMANTDATPEPGGQDMGNDYLVQKKPLNALIIFALPMIIGNLFQQTYTMADSAIVGRLVG